MGELGLNAAQYAKRCGRKSTKIVKRWYESGYLGSATKDEKTGVYDIPENTPIPYSADARIKRQSSLFIQLLDAADLNQAVFPSMYPLIPCNVFDAQLNEMVELGLLEVVDVESGLPYLRLLPSGIEVFSQLSDEKKRSSNVNKIERRINNGASVVTIGQALINLGFIVLSGQASLG